MQEAHVSCGHAATLITPGELSSVDGKGIRVGVFVEPKAARTSASLVEPTGSSQVFLFEEDRAVQVPAD